jgi:Antirestriction protein
MTIIRKSLSDDDRINIPAEIFGDYFPFHLEPFIFDMADRLSHDYKGGYWQMYELTNGAFYMAPDEDKPFKVSCENGYQGSLTADAFGITVCLYAYSHLSFKGDEEFADICTEQFHLLREYMLEHPEVREILGAID